MASFKVWLVRVGRIDLFEFVCRNKLKSDSQGLPCVDWLSVAGVLAPVLFTPLCVRLRFSVRSVVIVPSFSLVFQIVVLGVALLGNPRCSPQYRSSRLRALFLCYKLRDVSNDASHVGLVGIAKRHNVSMVCTTAREEITIVVGF